MKNRIIVILLIFIMTKAFGQALIYEADLKKSDTTLINYNDRILFPFNYEIKEISINSKGKVYLIDVIAEEIFGVMYCSFQFNETGLVDYSTINLSDSFHLTINYCPSEGECSSEEGITVNNIKYQLKFNNHVTEKKIGQKAEDINNLFVAGDNILNDAMELLKGNISGIPNSILEQIRKQEILKRYNIDYSKLGQDPFLNHLVSFLGNHRHAERFQYSSNITKADVTNFATGMARFLAERAKQELNESFFNQMRKQMEKLPELQFFFPQTYVFLHELNSHLKSFNLEVLRDQFNQDIGNLPRNIYHTTMNIDSYNGKHLKAITTFQDYLTHDKNGQFVNLGLQTVLNNNARLNPKDLFYNFVHNDRLLLKIEEKLLKEQNLNQSSINLLNAIKLVELISNSLLSPETDRYWVRMDEINELLMNKKLFRTYIGLLLAKSEFDEYCIKFDDNSLKELITKQFTNGGVVDDLKKLEDLIQSVFMLFNEVDNAVQTMKMADSGSSIDNTYNLYSVFSKSITTIVTKLDQQKVLGNSLKFNTDIVTNYLTPTVNLAYNIYSKKYSLAISDFVQLLNYATSLEEFERLTSLNKLDSLEKKRIMLRYYFDNYKDFKDDKLQFLSQSDSTILANLIFGHVYGREDLISLAKKYSIISNDPVFKHEYRYSTDTLRKVIVKYMLDTTHISVEEREKMVKKFFGHKSSREGIIIDDWISLYLKDKKSEDIYKMFDKLIDDEKFRSYLKENKAYQTFVTKFSKYGTLIGNVANAQSSDEVKAAIEASVLPVGSSRIKRYAKFSIGLNAFVGAYYGHAYYRDSNGFKNVNSFGITAPIGVSIAWGTSGWFTNKYRGRNCGVRNFIGKNNALGLNIQLIDLGSLVNFYYTKGDGAQLPAGTKIQLGDILAPGATVSYSLWNSPFSIMGGVQYVPNLSRMAEISTNKEFRTFTWRWHVGIAIDIPLFMIKTNLP